MAGTKAVIHGSNNFIKFYIALPPDSQLKRKIDDALDLLKHVAEKGDKVEKKLWPKKYKTKYGIDNLYRYEVGSHRMLYTI